MIYQSQLKGEESLVNSNNMLILHFSPFYVLLLANELDVDLYLANCPQMNLHGNISTEVGHPSPEICMFCALSQAHQHFFDK